MMKINNESSNLFPAQEALAWVPDVCRLSDLLAMNRATVRTWAEFARILELEG